MYIAFAPLQGYTDAAYRRAHHECVGGVDEYYTPFVRLVGANHYSPIKNTVGANHHSPIKNTVGANHHSPIKNTVGANHHSPIKNTVGANHHSPQEYDIRRKDLRDTAPAVNAGVPTVPQVIARDADEFARLCDALQEQGWNRIDLNMGCPFPMQVRAGRGSGLLQHPDKVEDILREMQQRPNVAFSVKMRLGQESIDEGLATMPIVNDMPLVHVTLHPRLGRQQYKGVADRETFSHLYEVCRHPVVYNGDITSMEEAYELRQHFPGLKGVMIGRGLLARPWMLGDKEPAQVLHDMHAIVYHQAAENLCGDSQILSHLHAFWEYIDIDRKQKKAIKKATTLPRYREAVAAVLRF
jgi:tRNA-dihydrouridine synthase